jgi:hypothetical protein
MDYGQRDHEIIDYEVFRLPGTGGLRGPAPSVLEPGEYFTCMGAAQTFGCFCERPYPALLEERLGLTALNFGFAGVGPRFFLQDNERARTRLEYVNRGSFAVLQVMSARSEDNSRFDSRGFEMLRRRSDGERMGAAPAYEQLLETETPERVAEIVAETRENWIQSYARLLQAIEVPTILFWFSKREPEYEEALAGVDALFGEFPQLVNRPMVEAIRNLADGYVECVTERGSPQRLLSRFTGEPVSITRRSDLGGTVEEFNSYYPSPEMHEDAASALLEACLRLVRSAAQ